MYWLALPEESATTCWHWTSDRRCITLGKLPSRGGQAGEINTEDLLENILSKFCIGK